MEQETGKVVINRKNGNFSIIPNEMLNDNRLSYKAKGILSYLLSKPNGWNTQVSDLYNKSTDGIESIRNGLKELLITGYSEIITKKEGGRERHIYDIPLFKEKYRSEENRNKMFSEKETLIEENTIVRRKGVSY